ncbi:hypothetical protein ACGFX8_30320 [Streptomyces sp. NPDC048362]|uniref:hypothetical protein n=1 Tax=Streptomyces sp. NPDC048362 TaxID=3365539 RepID=UPI0037128DE5
MSMPVLPAVGGFLGLGVAAIKVMLYLLWLELWLGARILYGCYWTLRALYWEVPRPAGRLWQRRQVLATANG